MWARCPVHARKMSPSHLFESKCRACGNSFVTCRSCFRNHAYCREACRVKQRTEQKRAARKRHRQSEEGRKDHRDAMRELRARARECALVGQLEEAPAAQTSPAQPAVSEDEEGVLAQSTISVVDQTSSPSANFDRVLPSCDSMHESRVLKEAPHVIATSPAPYCCLFCGRYGDFLVPFGEPWPRRAPRPRGPP